MKQTDVKTLRLEAVAYLLILLIGAGLRLADLGWPPLSDVEAGHALAAAALSGSPSPFDPAQGKPAPGASYTFPTAGLFQLFGSSDAMARVLPALAGLAVCLLPLLLRRRIGSGSALAFTALLSLSPVMVTASREAGPTSLACLGLFGMLASLVGGDPSEAGAQRVTWAVTFAALALTSGAAWVQGTIGLLVGGGLLVLWRNRRARPEDLFPQPTLSRRELVLGVVLALGLATGLGLHPAGAADPFESLGTWVSGWSRPSSMSIFSEVLLLPGYDPVLVVFGLVGMATAFRRRDALGIGAAFWALGALVLAVIYPSRSALDIVWVAVPVAYLAGRGILACLDLALSQDAWGRTLAMTGSYVALAGFVYLQMVAYASDLGVDLPPIDPPVRLTIIFVGILILLVLIVLFGTGWSWPAALSALAGAGLAVLLAMSLGSLVRLNFGRAAAEGGQLWEPNVSAVGLHELKSSLDFLSQAYRDDPGGLTLVVDGTAPPSLAWTVRDFDETPVSVSDQAPPVVLAPSDSQPALHADYLGQLLAISETNNWEGTFPPDVLTWWLLHQSPIRLDDWLMLVRADVATQGGLTALGSEATP